MRLTYFSVEGFKNFRKPVVLENLQAINVLHGENNVGKSNVLQAMLLFFWALRHAQDAASADRLVQGAMDTGKMTDGASIDVEFRQLASLADGRPESFFDLKAPYRTIKFAATIALDAATLPNGSKVPADTIDLALEIIRPSEAMITIVLTKYLCNWDQTKERQAPPTMLGWLSGTGQAPSRSRFTLLHTDRWRQGNLGDDAQRQMGTILSRRMELQLYDARDTPNREKASTWKRFLSVMEQFSDVLEGGTPNVVNPSDTAGGRGRPFLLVDKPDETRPAIDQMGSGVQQIVALIGSLLTSGGTIVGIEEPELNLRHSMQLRVMQALRDHVVGKPGGPDQLFITSHSAAFEFGDTFYGMSATPDGPEIKREDRSKLAKFIGATDSALQVPEGDSVVGWITSEGIVKVPAFVQEDLGAERGGAVVFWHGDHGRIEMVKPEDAERELSGKGKN